MANITPAIEDPAYQKVLQDLHVHQAELEMQNNELRQVEQKLLKSNQELECVNALFAQLYHKSPVGYVMLNDGTIINNANQTFADLVKMPSKKINGLSFTNFIAEHDKVLFASRFHAFFKNPENKQIELNLKTTDDKTIDVILKATLISDSALTGFQLLMSIDDISGVKKAEQEAKKAREIAEKASQEKSLFLSRMSHELRTPLNAILGFGQLLDMDENLDKEQHEDVQHILDAGKHLLNLINEILDIAKIDSGKMDFNFESLCLQHIVDSARTLTMPMLHKQKIKLLCPTNMDYRVIADSMRLKQILVNLISNAIKYNRTDGLVKISCVMLTDDYLRLNIEDTGAGIKIENQPQLFQPFSRVADDKEHIEGTGIGLAITKKLIESMNGKIGFKSEYQKGSIFWIDLPLADKPL